MGPDEPNLDEPGKPTTILVDGTPTEVEQTKRQNLQDLATACGSEEKVTPEACEAAGLDWREWGYFVVEMIEDQRWTEDHMLAYETRYEAAHRVKAPGMAELRARTRKDRLGLHHLQDDSEPTSDE